MRSLSPTKMQYTLSSSPGLPSLDLLLQRKPATRSKDRPTINSVPKVPIVSRSDDIRAQVDGIRATRIEESKPSKLKVNQTRKPRAKRSLEDAQSKLPKGRITKPNINEKSKSTSTVKLAETKTSSHHFSTNLDEPLILKKCETQMILGLERIEEHSEKAVARKMAWTPPARGVAYMDTQTATETPDTEVRDFKALFADFKFKREESTSSDSTTIAATNLTTRKRKLIELVKTSSVNEQAPKAKAKAPKKKARTITELATSKYLVPDDDQTSNPILQYLSPNQPSTVSTSRGPAKPTNSRTRSPVKRKKELVSSLLSPEAALKRAQKQEFVFGTSSQLMRNTSPSLLRDLQQAMRLSNQIEDDPFGVPLNLEESQCSTKSNGSVSLWHAGSRGENGNLLESDTIDLSYTPEPLRTSDSIVPSSIENLSFIDIDAVQTPSVPENHDGVNAATGRNPPSLGERNTESLDSSLVSTLPSHTKILGPVETAIRDALLGRSAIERSSTPTKKSTTKQPRRLRKLQKPDFALYTIEKLAQELRSYHFKPVKSRTAMITLLEKCWEGKQKVAAAAAAAASALTLEAPEDLGTLSARRTRIDESACKIAVDVQCAASTAEFAPNAFPCARGRGHSKMTAITTGPPLMASPTSASLKEPVVDSDSDTPLSARRPAIDFAGSLIVSPNPTSSELLHKHITAALLQQSRTTRSTYPSWHEKILLYDPIVLEDLAIWLNTSGLGAVGWDEEVTPMEVKRWCLEKSICCLWKENLRGGARARY